MRRPALLFLAGALLACTPVARAQHYVRLYLSTEGVEFPGDLEENSDITGTPLQAVQTVRSACTRLYVWAQLDSDGLVCNGISFNLRSTGSVRFTNHHVIDNTNVAPFAGPRWDRVAHGAIVGPNQNTIEGCCVVAARAFGVQSTFEAGSDDQYDPITRSVPIAFFDAEGAGDIFIEIGAQGVSRRAGPGVPGETVLLGFNDELDGLLGGSFLQQSSLRDARLVGGCQGDVNGDGVINTADLGLMLGDFGSGDPESDLNCDGSVNTADLGLLLNEFGGSCP